MKKLILIPVLWLSLATSSLAEKISLNEISSYLNSLTTVEATFSQRNPNGSRSSGKVYIRRPNRMRFEYDPPNEALVLASAGKVAIFDAKSNQPPEEYPLRRTPLKLILARRINLAQDRMVVAHQDLGNVTAVVAQDPQHPEYGTLQLMFAPNPTRLVSWVVTDENGAKTTVELSNVRVGETYPTSLFSITRETERRN